MTASVTASLRSPFSAHEAGLSLFNAVVRHDKTQEASLLPLCKELINQGADVTVRGAENRAAAEWCVRKNFPGVLALIFAKLSDHPASAEKYSVIQDAYDVSRCFNNNAATLAEKVFKQLTPQPGQ